MCTEFMRLVNKDKVIFISIPIIIVVFIKYLLKAAVTNEACIFVKPKILECLFPVLLNSRRIYNKNLCVLITIVDTELLCYHCSDYSFTKTHNISKEETIIL